MRIPYDPPERLARWHTWARSQAWLARFTLMNRLLLAMAFLPTGLVKATGQRFTLLPLEDPVGFFFEAMYRTGPYWYFIGISQIAASILLLIPSTATLGALLFLPIVLSIVLITWGVGFTGTVWVTTAMLVAVLYLLCWDGDRVWRAAHHLLGPSRGPGLLKGATRVEYAGWALGGTVGMALLLVTRSFLPGSWVMPLLGIGILAASLVVGGWTISAVRGRGSRAGSRAGSAAAIEAARSVTTAGGREPGPAAATSVAPKGLHGVDPHGPPGGDPARR